ncbi:flagellar hook assembly protein FlgD [Hansschlegelia sp.]|uniref:flagellar hook assembly protein FlgD n=1 Tax=Hansschlegelia sp. TaxID=2041892 RepID=UPI002BE68693|nr:flagellar hook capping FlgD N-terminal domain-containing protein [Hansschlegelia sp.]HVI30403.1 flagellar hook capping FlgD N-terminal domain-containing protein [Hansschlegelia sp.]
MAVDPLSGAASTSSATATTRTTLASNFDTFLTLLTTQLKNQNPLDPLDTNQFTQQLVQFAGVEQQLKTNDTLTALLSATQTSQAGTALGLVGKSITAEGDTSLLSGDSAKWRINAPKDGVAGTITIRDANGSVVATKEVELAYGDQDFTWDGRKADGSRATGGLYSISIDAHDVAGNAVTVTSEVSGVVDGVDLSTGQAVLLMGDLRIPLGSLKSVRTAS